MVALEVLVGSRTRLIYSVPPRALNFRDRVHIIYILGTGSLF